MVLMRSKWSLRPDPVEAGQGDRGGRRPLTPPVGSRPKFGLPSTTPLLSSARRATAGPRPEDEPAG